MHLITLAPPFFSFGLDVAVKATVLLGLAVLIVALCRRSSAALRHSIWLVAMLGLFWLPVLSWALPAWRLPILPAGWGEVRTATATVIPPLAPPFNDESPQIVTLPPLVVTPPSPREPLLRSEPGPSSYGPGNESPVQEPAAIPVADVISDVETPAPVLSQWPLVIVVLWAIGAVLFALAILRGSWRTAVLYRQSQLLDEPRWRAALETQKHRLSLRRQVALREHPRPVVPLTWGVLRPVILLPQLARQWSQSMQRIVLMHELAHIQRGDVIAQLIGRIACALHWYHPLAWYALRKLRREREQACDDAVVQAGEKASDYAEQLVEVARLCLAPGGLSMAIAMAEGNSLERRVKSLFDLTHGHGPVRKFVVAVLFVVGAFIVGTLSAIDPIPQSAAATSTAGVERTGDISPEVLGLLRPEFGEAKRGIQLGVAVNSLQKSFALGEKIPLTLLYRNVGSETLTFDTHLDFVADPPLVTNERGERMQVSFIMHWMFIGPTTITLEPGQTWAINTTGLGLGKGGSVNSLEKPVPGKYRLTYQEGIFEKLGLPASMPVWNEHLTTGPLEFEIVANAAGTLQAMLASAAGGDRSAQPTRGPALQSDVQPPRPVTREEAFAALVRGGKISTNSLNAMIRLVADEGATDPEFIERVLSELNRSCEAGRPNRNLLAVLRDMFAIHGARRWQLELAARRPQDASVQVSEPDLGRITDEFQQKALQRVISQARKATRTEIDDFVMAVRNAHHQDTKAFLLDVLHNPESNGGPTDPLAVQLGNKRGRWPDNLGGSWTDAKFHAAVGLAELGAVEGVDWLLAKAAPNDFGIDGSLFGAWRHVRETRGSLRENCRYSLAELFGLDLNADHHRLTEWWQAGLGEYLPNPVSLGKAIAPAERPKNPASTQPPEETGSVIRKPQLELPMLPEKIDLNQHVLWWEKFDGIQVGFWMLDTGDPQNLRVPEDSLVTYYVVVRNTTEQPVEFVARALPYEGLETPALISSDDIIMALESSPLEPRFLAQLVERRGERPLPAYLIRLAPGEAAIVPGRSGVAVHGLQVGGKSLDGQPLAAITKPGMNWVVQPVTLWRADQELKTQLTRLLGAFQLTRIAADGTVHRESATRVTGMYGGQTFHPRIQLEVGTLNSAAARNAEHAVWGNAEQGMQCGIRIINPQPSYQSGDTLEAEVLWRNTSEAVVTTSKPRPLDLYPIIEDAEGDGQLIDFGARYELMPLGHDFQPGEVRSLGVTQVTLVAQGTPGPQDNKEPGHITLKPGEYMFSASGGVGNISPQSGKVPFTVIAGGKDPHADTPAAAVPENDASPASRPVIDQ